VRIQSRLYGLTDSLWLIPAICTISAIALALGLVALDQRITLDDRASGSPWLYGGGAEGARGVLTAIAGTMIGVAGTVFSITIVALQLASSQFTPRVLRHFTGDRGNQVVLGVFIGTFTYALLVMRSVHSEADDRNRFVPVVSVSVAGVLALVAVGMLIFQIDHVAKSIQAATIVERATAETLDVIRSLASDSEDEASSAALPFPSDAATWVAATDGGYLESMDVEGILEWACRHGVTVSVAPIVGAFIPPRQPVIGVWPGQVLSADDEKHLRRSLVTGRERSLRSDPAFGVRQISDIAIRALSPGINDPTTATTCIDRLGELLIVAASEGGPFGDRTRIRGEGRIRVAGQTFESLVSVAFAQIRHYGAGDATVMVHLLNTLGMTASLVDEPFGGPLVDQARLSVESARGSISIPADLARVERAAAWTATMDSRIQA